MRWDDDPEIEETDALAAPDYPDEPMPVDEADDDWAPPVAPLTRPDATPAADAEDDLLDQDWTPEKGFSDPTNSVRVWADPEGGLEKVRVSLSWRTRLAGRPLGEAVTVAFMLMNNYLFAYTGEPDADLPRITRKPSQARVAEITARFEQIEAELAELDPLQYPGHREIWEPAIGTDFEDGVSVQLDRTGRPAIAKFDPNWLRTANSRELAVGIMSSYRRAKAVHQPPVRTLDRAGELMAEQRALLHELAGPRRSKSAGPGPVASQIPAMPGVMSLRPPGRSDPSAPILDAKTGERSD